MSWRGAIYQSHMTVNDMGLFGNDVLDELFGGIFDTKKQEEILDDYWSHGNVQEYYRYLNEIKKSGKRVYRNSSGKHMIKIGGL